MKKSFIIVVWIFANILTVSCSRQKDRVPASDKEGNYMEKQDITSSVQGQGSMPDAPYIIVFDSFEEIKEFVSSAAGTATQYTDFVNKHGEDDSISLISQDVAKKVSSNITNTVLPINNSAEKFGGSYYVNEDKFHLYYRVDGIRYGLTYSFHMSAPHSYKGTPVLKNMALGSMPLDMYQGDKCFCGSVQIGTTAIQIVVDTEKPEKVNFDSFYFAAILPDMAVQ